MRLKVTAGEAASWRNATFFCFTKNKKRALSVRAPEKSRGQTKDKFSGKRQTKDWRVDEIFIEIAVEVAFQVALFAEITEIAQDVKIIIVIIVVEICKDSNSILFGKREKGCE